MPVDFELESPKRRERVSYRIHLCMLLEAESWKVHACTEDASFRQDTDTSDAINLHLHVWVAVWVSEIGKMWSPGSILCVAFEQCKNSLWEADLQ